MIKRQVNKIVCTLQFPFCKQITSGLNICGEKCVCVHGRLERDYTEMLTWFSLSWWMITDDILFSSLGCSVFVSKNSMLLQFFIFLFYVTIQLVQTSCNIAKNRSSLRHMEETDTYTRWLVVTYYYRYPKQDNFLLLLRICQLWPYVL